MASEPDWRAESAAWVGDNLTMWSDWTLDELIAFARRMYEAGRAAERERVRPLVEAADTLEGVRSGRITVQRPQWEVEGEAWETLSNALRTYLAAESED